MYSIVSIITRCMSACSTFGKPNRLHCMYWLTSVSSAGEHQSCSGDRGQTAAEPTLHYRECRASHGKAGTLPVLCLACENTHTEHGGCQCELVAASRTALLQSTVLYVWLSVFHQEEGTWGCFRLYSLGLLLHAVWSSLVQLQTLSYTEKEYIWIQSCLLDNFKY